MNLPNRSFSSRLLAAWLGALLLASPFAGLAASGAQSGTAGNAARQYRVARGDSLTSVARKFGISVAALAAANGLRADAELLAGVSLAIPSAGAQVAAPAASPAPVRYRVRSGDTLTSIAQQFGVSVASLRSWNGLNSSSIRVGQQLTVNSAGPRTVASTATRAARPVAQPTA